MAGGTHGVVDHTHLHVHGDSRVHRMAPQAKLVALVVFVVAVASTPRRAVGAFAVDALVLVVVLVAARLSPRVVLGRLVVIVPFLAFAVLVPFVAGGEQVGVVGLELSRDGLWAAWNVTAKATLGATASIVLAATTPVPDVLRGMTRLRVPKVVVAIVAFMFRYLDVLVDQLRRMRSAMVARCHDPRWLWQARPVAASAGTLFVRSYERGERVHQAMLARGYGGAMPELDDPPAARSDWVLALAPGVTAISALVVAWAVT